MTKNDDIIRMCGLCESLFARGYAVGGAGNVSIKTESGGFVVTPTGSCLGRLDPEKLAEFDKNGTLISDIRPSKEFAFHRVLYDVRPEIGAVVHLHSTYLTALSCLENLDRENALRAFTPYYVMRVGHLPVVPYYRPGAPEIARDLEIMARNHAVNAFLLASHGVVVLGKTIEEAVGNAEELEETAKLFFLLNEKPVHYLSEAEIAELVK
ncbi:aldolase [Cohaesibacter haloalkalitolerans]|uniref:3-oxo-tetronate 4-phosphate decarboxylase n=1 Tax=Cohaesibacter haloalkalitolerans TaxID=1162980 RepID=UPI000E64D157|nr:aldolase [Cohaesibacter haloalkalitolerans]